MNYRGWMFIGFSDEYPAGKINPRTFMNEEWLVFRTGSGELQMIEPYCSHFGVNMTTGKVVKDYIQCPMHGRLFGGDGRCANPKYRSIRSRPVSENRGLAYAWFDHAGVEPQWDPPCFLDEERFPHILWRHSRMLSLHHPSVPLDNSVDPRHFKYTHTMFGKHIEDGVFEPDGHKALGTMATVITPPLSWFSGDRVQVITRFDSPLNTHLTSIALRTSADICNLVTIIEGKACRLTQIGIGRRSMNPLRWLEDVLGLAGSWWATYEDAPIWNDRKVQEPDSHAHQTDRALAEFREWFETFAYDPEQEPARTKLKTVG